MVQHTARDKLDQTVDESFNNKMPKKIKKHMPRKYFMTLPTMLMPVGCKKKLLKRAIE